MINVTYRRIVVNNILFSTIFFFIVLWKRIKKIYI